MRLLTLRDIHWRYGPGRWLMAAVRDGRFPAPLRVGRGRRAKIRGWRPAEVDVWERCRRAHVEDALERAGLIVDREAECDR